MRVTLLPHPHKETCLINMEASLHPLGVGTDPAGLASQARKAVSSCLLSVCNRAGRAKSPKDACGVCSVPGYHSPVAAGFMSPAKKFESEFF